MKSLTLEDKLIKLFRLHQFESVVVDRETFKAKIPEIKMLVLDDDLLRQSFKQISKTHKLNGYK